MGAPYSRSKARYFAALQAWLALRHLAALTLLPPSRRTRLPTSSCPHQVPADVHLVCRIVHQQVWRLSCADVSQLQAGQCARRRCRRPGRRQGARRRPCCRRLTRRRGGAASPARRSASPHRRRDPSAQSGRQGLGRRRAPSPSPSCRRARTPRSTWPTSGRLRRSRGCSGSRGRRRGPRRRTTPRSTSLQAIACRARSPGRVAAAPRALRRHDGSCRRQQPERLAQQSRCPVPTPLQEGELNDDHIAMLLQPAVSQFMYSASIRCFDMYLVVTPCFSAQQANAGEPRERGGRRCPDRCDPASPQQPPGWVVQMI